ncbi:MAG: NAD-binding protein [Anaerolineae bacterium]
MKIIVVGCGRVGARLGYRLSQKGHQVTMVDQVAAAFDNLPADFRGRTVEGEVLAQGVLHRAGVEEADGLAAVTNSDSLNAVVAHLVRTTYQVPNVVVRNYDPRWRPLQEAFGLQVISSASWGAQRLEELLYATEIPAVFTAGHGEVNIYEFVVPDGWRGHTLQELLPEVGCLPVALTRSGQAMLPSRDTCLEACDIVHVSATWEGIDALRHRLSSQRGG